jgi:charged multivesicular body protein 2A
MPYDRS